MVPDSTPQRRVVPRPRSISPAIIALLLAVGVLLAIRAEARALVVASRPPVGVTLDRLDPALATDADAVAEQPSTRWWSDRGEAARDASEDRAAGLIDWLERAGRRVRSRVNHSDAQSSAPVGPWVIPVDPAAVPAGLLGGGERPRVILPVEPHVLSDPGRGVPA